MKGTMMVTVVMNRTMMVMIRSTTAAMMKVFMLPLQVDKFFTATATVRANASLDGLDKCGEVPKDSMHLLRSAQPGESDLPWFVAPQL